ncbi:hypothetical protein [Stutzerimonas nitrititolerans]|uniref:hypothetical protein n=1 Tax=Stutzerimonas nitrititolerans TaxID=2482751 RepID=UPI002648B9AD|nr:hypothetical protein [Stutzerimonas nitrititolerans]
MTDFWSSWLAFALLAGPLLLIVVGMVFSLYIDRRHLADILAALKNSRYIVFWAAGLSSQGRLGRLMLIAKICGMVLCPKSGIRAGELDPDDIRNFPVHLKRLLIAKTTLMVITLVWGVLAYALLKLK